MRVLITSVGSHGDVNPYIAVARELQRRGHEVLFLCNEYFRSLAEEARLPFAPIGEPFDLTTLRDHPDVMHHMRGGEVVFRELIIPFIRDSHACLRSVLRDFSPDVVVHHHICMGVPWVCERAGVLCVAGVLAPMMWMTRGDPLVLSPLMSANAPRWLSTITGGVVRWVARCRIDGWINPIRRELGLAPVRDSFAIASRGGTATLGLWSPVLRAAHPNDPPHAHICGFPLYDRHQAQEHAPDEIERFLQDGEPPILFSLGTAAVHVAGSFYEIAAETCRRMGRRGMLLVGRAPHVAPRDLPSGVGVFSYAPFSSVMPRVAASVHHGGIGTTAQGMHAGKPVVVVPHAHDQFDNAARLKRLLISQTVPATRLSPSRLERVLRRVLDDPGYARRAGEVSRRMAGEDGGIAAAKVIERVVAGG